MKAGERKKDEIIVHNLPEKKDNDLALISIGEQDVVPLRRLSPVNHYMIYAHTLRYLQLNRKRKMNQNRKI